MLCSGASWTLPGGGPPRGLIGAILPSVESPLRRSCTFDGSSDHALYPTVPCPVDERDVGLVLICAKAQRKSTCPLASLRCTTREAARGRAMDVLAGQTSLMSADGRPAVVVLLLFVLFFVLYRRAFAIGAVDFKSFISRCVEASGGHSKRDGCPTTAGFYASLRVIGALASAHQFAESGCSGGWPPVLFSPRQDASAAAGAIRWRLLIQLEV